MRRGTHLETPEMVCGPTRQHSLRKSSFGYVLGPETPLLDSPRSFMLARRARKSFSEVRMGLENPLLMSLVVDEQGSAENKDKAYKSQTRESAESPKRLRSLWMRPDVAGEFIEKYRTSTNRSLSDHETLQKRPLPKQILATSTEPGLQQKQQESSTVENYRSSREINHNAAEHMLTDDSVRVYLSGENSHDDSTTTIAVASSPNLLQTNSHVSNRSPPATTPVKLDQKRLARQLTENIPLHKHLAHALGNWAEARKLLCRLRSLQNENSWVAENWDILFKPCIAAANDMNLLVAAFRDSAYCPPEWRLPGNEDLEPKELNDLEMKHLMTLLREAVRILRFIFRSCTRPDWSLWFRLLNLRQDLPDRRTELEQLAGQLEVALSEKGIVIESSNGSEKVSGALKSATLLDHNVERSCNSPNRRMFAWIDTLSLFFESDCMSTRIPLLARLKYQKLKLRFRSVPISVSAPSTVVDSSSDDIMDWKIRLKTTKKENGTMGKVELDEEDRKNIAEAILTYQQFRDQISSQSSVDTVLLSHKVTTRIKRYQSRLQGRTHMCAMINVRTDYECDSGSQCRNSSPEEQDTDSDGTDFPQDLLLALG